MTNRGAGRLGSGDSRDGSRAAVPVGVDAHRAKVPAPADGEEAHRAKLAPARRHKRPACETELPGRETPQEAPEVGAGDAVPSTEPASRRRGGVDRDQFETLIIREWTKTLKGPYDWADWPLARYTFAAGFLDAFEQQRGLSAVALARACAMVACGRAERLRSIDPRPRLDADGSPLSRPDGATAWCCNLRRDALAGHQLHYWVSPIGRIEFETVTAPDKSAEEAVTAPGEGTEGTVTVDVSATTQDRPWRG